MRVILYRPRIPWNTGNVIRTCSVTGVELVLVRPLGFRTDDRSLKRAGLDYREGVRIVETDDLPSYLKKVGSSFYFFSRHAERSYAEVSYAEDAILIFGSEVSGLPAEYRVRWPDRFVTLPVREGSRCLNLSTAVGIAVYEAQRQAGFPLGRLTDNGM
ncbi:MAG: tRNA (cytidine(34)-2'-O)-methyltransferase [Simkaniaceae bacterium]|nr:tRNA (cytidine(34)-2'-O)-methyltransferase [Simkaniaceae bacterium]